MEIVHPILGKYQIVDKIGRGSFASVYLAKHQKLQYPVAIKIIKKGNDDINDRNSFDLFKSIMHPFICQDFDFIKTPQGNDCVIMEYIEGKTLLEYANLNAPLPEKEIQTIFGQLVIAIDFLHKHQIIHRDLKCENIMIDKYKNIRLIDLSFSCNNHKNHSTLCGSPAYIAPEIISHQNYGNSVDIWSMGIILYALTYGKLPFENQNYSILFHLITSANPTFAYNDKISSNLVDLIQKILVKDPNQRISIDDIKKHPFFTSDSNGNEYAFSEQQINLFVREPETQIAPEIQVLQKMELSKTECVDATNEIKSGQQTYYSMTYNILYKNYITTVQMPYLSRFLLQVGKGTRKNGFQLKIDISNVKNQKNEIQTQRVDSKARFNLSPDGSDLTPPQSPNSSREKFVLNNNYTQVGRPMFINGHVQFRRFSSVSKPLGNIVTKRSLINLNPKNLLLSVPKPSKPMFGKLCSTSVEVLPQLEKP